MGGIISIKVYAIGPLLLRKCSVLLLSLLRAMVRSSIRGADANIGLALDAAEKKFGGAKFAGPDAAQKNRGMNEKITDGIRKMVEKVTG